MTQQAFAYFLNGGLETAPFQRTAFRINAKKDQSWNRATPTDDQFSEVLVLSQQYPGVFIRERDGCDVGHPRRKFCDINDIVARRTEILDQRCVNTLVGKPAHDSGQP